MKKVTLILILISNISIAQTNLRYEGYIENSGTPVNATSQSFTVHILNPTCATPLISSTTTADIVSGEFNIAPTFADSNLFSSIMNPSFTNGSCPSASANRIFRIEWNAQTFDIAMNDAARSGFSNASAKLGERTQDQFLKVDTNTSYTPLTTANVSTLLDLISGTNTQYLRPSNSFSGDISGVFNAISVNRLRGINVAATAPSTNQVLKFNGTDWAPAADDSGASDPTKLPLTGGTMTGSVNMGSQNISNATSVASTNFSGRNFLAFDADSSNSVAIRTPANVSTDYSLTLPPDDGIPGQFLSTDGTGVLSWSTSTVNYGLGAFQTPQVAGTSLSANGVVTTNATNTGLTTINCTLNQIIKFDASGFAYCSTDLVAVQFPSDTTTGSSIAIGTNALQFQTTPAAYNNIALGFNAMSSSGISPTAINNIAIGRNVLDSITTGKFNIGIGGDDTLGNYTLNNLTTGEENTSIGMASGASLTIGTGNTAVGFKSFSLSVAGNDNTYIGADSGSNADADNDTAIGIRTLRNSQNGYNTAVGAQALESVNSGTDNIGIGYRTGIGLTSGSNNVLLGSFAGDNITIGNSNLILGKDVGSTTLQTGSGNILIGTSSLVDTPSTSTNQFLNIGNAIFGDLTTGNIGIGTSSPSAKLDVNGSFKLGSDGTILPKMIKCNGFTNVASPLSQFSSAFISFSCPGAAVGMHSSCSLTSPSDDLSLNRDLLIITGTAVSSAGLVRFKVTNLSATAFPTSTSLNVTCLSL